MTDPLKRVLDPEPKPDDRLDTTLRPQTLSDLIGQEQVKENLAILIAAARQRSRAGERRAADEETASLQNSVRRASS